MKDYLAVLHKFNIDYFYHFTNITNLDSILKNGIMSVKELQERNIKYSCTDEARNDRQFDCVSLSLVTSNKSMMKLKKEHINTEWVVFEINAISVISKLYDKIYYCKYNAASPSTINLLSNNKAFLKTPKAFNSMFDDNNKPFYQSELLVSGIIDVADINRIYVENLHIKMLVEQVLMINNIDFIEVVIKREMF